MLFLTKELPSLSIYHSNRELKFKGHLFNLILIKNKNLIIFHIYTVTENTLSVKTHFPCSQIIFLLIHNSPPLQLLTQTPLHLNFKRIYLDQRQSATKEF